MQADGFFQPPPGYMVCVLPTGVQAPPGAILVPMAGQMPDDQLQQQAFRPQAEPSPMAQMPNGCFMGPMPPPFSTPATTKQEDRPTVNVKKDAIETCSSPVSEPAPEPSAEEQGSQGPADQKEVKSSPTGQAVIDEAAAERKRRLARLTAGPAGPTSAASLLAKRMQIMQARRTDHSMVSALNIDKFSRSVTEGAKRAPQLRFLRELEEQKKAAEKQQEQRKPGFADARSSLLSFRSLAPRMPPKEISTLAACSLRDAFGQAPLQRQVSTPIADSLPRQAMQRQRTTDCVPARSPKEAASPIAAKRGELTELESLRRDVNSLLNKVCPEKFTTVVGKLTAIKVNSVEALEIIIELIFKKALSEPHYSETYADLVFGLRSTFPEFPARDGRKMVSFKSSVLHICQAEFEELLSSPEPSDHEVANRPGEDFESMCQDRRARMRANMRFVGHLFLRQLLSAKVIGGIISELTLCDIDEDVAPQENAIECACELLNSVGFTLEAMPAGQVALPAIFERLRALKVMKTPEGKGSYTKRVQFMIQDIIDTREAGWTRKVFRTSAKTMEEIRACGPERGGETVVVGQRPTYLTNEVERFLRTHTA
jgi:hypothetical protein